MPFLLPRRVVEAARDLIPPLPTPNVSRETRGAFGTDQAQRQAFRVTAEAAAPTPIRRDVGTLLRQGVNRRAAEEQQANLSGQGAPLNGPVGDITRFIGDAAGMVARGVTQPYAQGFRVPVGGPGTGMTVRSSYNPTPLSLLGSVDTPVVSGNRVVEELTRPSNIIGGGVRSISFARNAPAGVRLGAEMAASGIGRFAGEQTYERTEGLPEPVRVAASALVGMGAAVGAGVGVGRAGARWAEQGMPVGMSLRDLEREVAGLQAKVAKEGLTPENIAKRDELMAQVFKVDDAPPPSASSQPGRVETAAGNRLAVGLEEKLRPGELARKNEVITGGLQRARKPRGGDTLQAQIIPGVGREAATGGVLGAAGGYGTGDTPEERLKRALIGAAGGAVAGGIAGRMLNRAPTRQPLPVPPKVPTATEFTAPPTVQKLYGTQAIEEGTTRGRIERYLDEGRIRADEPTATPALLVRAESRRAVSNQATRTAETARSVINDAKFEMDDAGRIGRLAGIEPNVPGAPTLRDVAARLPVYEPYLTDEQLDALHAIRDSLAPYRQALDEVAQAEAGLTGKPSSINPGSRVDVMEGGFYIPRGTAETEELADIAARRAKGGSGRPGREGFEKTATFGSEAEGIAAGYAYTPVVDSIAGYVRGIGNRTLDRHAANYFLSRTDDAGNRLGQTAADRISPQLRSRVEKLRNQISQRRETVRNQRVRQSALTPGARGLEREAERARGLALSAETRALMRKADIEEIDTFMPEVAREALPEVDVLVRRADGLRGRIQYRPDGKPVQNAANRGLVRQLGEVEALTDIRRIADEAGDDYGLFLDRIEEYVERSSRYSTPVKPIKGGGMGKAPAFGSPERLQWDADRKAGLISSRKRSSQGASAEQAPFEGPMDAVRAYEETLEQALTRPSVDVSRTPSPDDVIKAAEREMRIMQREAARIEGLAGGASQRAARATSNLDESMQGLRSLQDELDAIKGEWDRAKSQAAGTPRDQGNIPLRGLEAYSFPWEIADEAKRILEAETPKNRGAALQALNGLMRGQQATGEMSYIGIQGAIGMASGNRAWRRATKAATRAWLNGGENTLGNHFRQFDARAAKTGRPTLEQYAAAGGRLGGGQTEFKLARGPQAVTDFADTRRSASAAKWAAGIPLRVPRSIARRADRGFGGFGDVIRAELWDTAAEESIAAGRVLDDVELRKIVEAVNRVTGWTPQRVGGTVGEMLNFAPRYLLARIRALAQLGSRDVRQRQLARRLIGRYIAIGSTLTIVANELNGHDTDFRPFRGESGTPTWNPLEATGKNPNFMRVLDVAGRDWSLLGPVDATMGVLVGAGSLLSNPTANPEEALSRLRTVFSSPLVSAGLDWLVFGENFEGDQLNTGEALASDLMRRVVPFAAPELLDVTQETIAEGQEGDIGGALLEAGAGLVQAGFGGRGSRMTARELADRQLRDRGMNPGSLTSRQRVSELAATPEGMRLLEEQDKERLKRAAQGDRTAKALAVAIKTRERLQALADAGLSHSEYRDQRTKIMAEQRGAMATYEDVFEGFAESDNPVERDLSAYFDLFSEAETPWGITDDDRFEELESTFIEQVGPARWEAVQEQLGLVDPRLPEQEREYRQVRGELDEAGFFDIGDQSWGMLQRSKYAGAEQYKTYYEWYDVIYPKIVAAYQGEGFPKGVAEDIARAEIEKMPQAKAYSQLKNQLETLWVGQNPDLTDRAIQWGYFSPNQPERELVIGGGR